MLKDGFLVILCNLYLVNIQFLFFDLKNKYGTISILKGSVTLLTIKQIQRKTKSIYLFNKSGNIGSTNG